MMKRMLDGWFWGRWRLEAYWERSSLMLFQLMELRREKFKLSEWSKLFMFENNKMYKASDYQVATPINQLYNDHFYYLSRIIISIIMNELATLIKATNHPRLAKVSKL